MHKLRITLSLLFLFLLTAAVDCKKETDLFKTEGIITGPDVRMCACCGGWFISIDTSSYEFDSVPQGTPIDLDHATFPLKVRFDWTTSTRICGANNYITILRMKPE